VHRTHKAPYVSVKMALVRNPGRFAEGEGGRWVGGLNRFGAPIEADAPESTEKNLPNKGHDLPLAALLMRVVQRKRGAENEQQANGRLPPTPEYHHGGGY
jgi:hypothetical protein